MPVDIKCPECGTQLGGKNGVAPYEHAVDCMHLNGQGPDRDLEAEMKNPRTDDEGKRRRILVLKSIIGGR